MEKYYRELNPTGLRFGIGNSYSFPPHIHEDVELMCITEGVHIAYVDGKQYVLNQGDFLLICPNQVHSFERANENNLHFTMIIKPAMMGEIGHYLQENAPIVPVWEGEPGDPISQMLQLCYKEYKKNGEQEILYSQIQCLLQMLCRELDFNAQPARGDGSIRRIMQFCAEHYKENISMKDLAENVFLSQSHISHIFSEKLKISFPDYINALRTAEAAKLLRRSDHTVSEVAVMSGFTTIRSFNRAFQKQYGVSPKEYRKK